MNKIYLFCVLLHSIQLCVSKEPVITLQMLNGGDVENLRSQLTGNIAPDRLDNFLRTIHKLRPNATEEEGSDAYPELFALIFASKSATSQEDWGKIFSDDTSKLTPVENQEIDKLDEESKKDGMILLKIILRRRLSTTDANHVIDILDRYDNRNLLILALASAAAKTESEVQKWVTS